MNKKLYRAPETEVISVKYASHILTASLPKEDEDWDAEAKGNNFMEPADGASSHRFGRSNPWSGWEDDDK